MCEGVGLLAAVLLFCMGPFALADIAAIHTGDLPQETAVLGALDDAKRLEPFSHSWTQDWKYPVPKNDANARLGKDLGFLELAIKTHPNNVELLLLTGLVAHYAYNVDVTGSYDAAVKALGEAQKLSPSDFRVAWFRAGLRCQTFELKLGAEEFLSLEDSHQFAQLPSAFWEDYMECVTVANMPAHVLRAADHLEKMQSPASSARTFFTQIARKRFDPFDSKKDYAPKEAWQAVNTAEDTEFTSTSCGVKLRVPSGWSINQIALTKGSCVAYFSTGPYKATTRELRPSVVLLVKQPEKDETLEDFSKRFLTKGSFEPFEPSRCPAERCIAKKGIQPGMYENDGDGHGRLVFFEKSQPDFPGLIFESPSDPPKADSTEGVQYFRARQIQARIPGKLFYVVVLDAAASIEDPAIKDYEFFLKHITVE